MKTITFVIPIYNEEKRLHKTFLALKRFKSPDGLKLQEVIFVDDGSKDTTAQMIKATKSTLEKTLRAKIKLISYSQNQGKGYAVKQGMLASNADYSLFFDADMSTPLSELEKFIPFIKKGTDAIIGTRKNGKSTVLVHQSKIRELLGKGFTLITQKILNLKTTDFTCGFKAFSKNAGSQIFKKSTIKRWGYDAEIVFLAQKYDFSIAEKAVTWSNDQNTKVNLFKAVPQTFFELFLIYWRHEIKLALLLIHKNLNIINRYGLSI
jgi:glycosyltransferase involved in cell wall biosynthesis